MGEVYKKNEEPGQDRFHSIQFKPIGGDSQSKKFVKEVAYQGFHSIQFKPIGGGETSVNVQIVDEPVSIQSNLNPLVGMQKEISA